MLGTVNRLRSLGYICHPVFIRLQMTLAKPTVVDDVYSQVLSDHHTVKTREAGQRPLNP